MTGTLWRSSLRYHVRHPWLLVLSLAGVALGVAVITAVDLASESARRGFNLSAEAVAGRATHRIEAGARGVPDRLYAELRIAGVRPSAPVVEGFVQVAERTMQLLGVDPLAERPLGRASASAALSTALLTEPAAVLLHPRITAELGLETGARFDAFVRGVPRRLLLAGMLQSDDAALDPFLENLVLADIATAQELLGRPGRLSRIDLVAPEDGVAAWRERIRARLPAGVVLIPVDRDVRFMAELTAAFSLNLTALSLLALLVGAFLVYNMMSFSVLQRLPLLGILRGLGVSRAELFRVISIEALAIGALGTLLGLLLGVLLANGLVRLVTRTIDDLYFAMTVSELHLSGTSLAKGLLLGVLASWLAALKPAVDAARVSTAALMRRSWIESRARRQVLGLVAGGALLLLSAAVTVALSDGLPGGFAALLLLIVGGALCIPAAVRLFSATAGRLAGAVGPVYRIAARSLGATLSRTGVAAAALTVAVATTVGIGVMIDSFRTTVDRWLEQRLQADIYVSSPGAQDRYTAIPLDPGVVSALAALPGVAATSSYRGVRIESGIGPLQLAVVDLRAAGREGHRLKRGDPASAWRAFEEGAVLLSEPFAHRSGLAVGDRIPIVTPDGMRRFPVAGVFYDYGGGGGSVLMSRTTYDRHWNDPAISSLGLYAAPGASLTELLDRVRERLAGSRLRVTSSGALHSASLAVFDRTFRITEVLRMLAIAVAFVGVLSACLALQLENRREHAMLRALGLLPGQLRGLVTWQAGLLGLVAGIAALPLGLAMAGMLTTVINERAFGWTLPLIPDGWPFVEALLLAVGAALLAGLLASLRAARPALDQDRE